MTDMFQISSANVADIIVALFCSRKCLSLGTLNRLHMLVKLG